MGPKCDKAAQYQFDNSAFNVTREQAIEWVNKVLEHDFEDVEDMSMRGSEWCQLVHFCTIPEEGIVDIEKVQFQQKLDRQQVDTNYEILKCALARLGVDCPFLEGKEEELKMGCYSEAIDFLHWLKHFVQYMGAPMYSHPKDDREEVLTKQHEAERTRVAGAKKAQEQSVRRATRGGVSRRATHPRVETNRAAPKTRLRDTTNTVQPRATKAASAGAPPQVVEGYQRKVSELEAELASNQELLQRLATSFDRTFKNVNQFLSSSDVHPEVTQHVGYMLQNFMAN
eukprot:TRINITY_DN1474_c5_g1_i1.p1 TRINITY_DN1474_c5_g1~~TRINITY_DN1474_c5_g1_i1.p1  ORF type:complete len:284 (+),score=80.09 TRINITY_DN1474_c5_g1_i1:63-914(+)